MIETYFENANSTIEKLHSMFDRMISTADSISLEFVSDEDSVEVDIDAASSDNSRFQTACVAAKEALNDIQTGISQTKNRFDTLSSTVSRRKAQLEFVDNSMAKIAAAETSKNADELIDEVTSPKKDFAALKAQYPDFTDEQINILLNAGGK